HSYSLRRVYSPPHTYPHSLHDALPIFRQDHASITRAATQTEEVFGLSPQEEITPETSFFFSSTRQLRPSTWVTSTGWWYLPFGRSEEHTSELQSRFELVCRLLREKKRE